MTTAFVLSGGANLGAIQVGQLRALHRAGIRPDLLVGASVGAVNAAWLAGADPDAGLDGLEGIWRSLRRRDVFPTRFAAGLAGFLGQRPALFDTSGLRRLLERHLAFDLLENAPIPLHVVVTDLLDGTDIALSTGSTVAAVLASAAIPGIFPPVVIGGRSFVDGGVVNNAPVSHAVDLGADIIYVLPTGYACALEQPPGTALAITLHAASLMINRRLGLDAAHYIDRVDLRVIPPPCPITVRPGDFSRADDLIRLGDELTTAWLAGGARRHDLLAAHHHAMRRPGAAS